MKLITLADIHHSEKNWDHLVDAVRQHQPDLVAIAGDLMPIRPLRYGGKSRQPFTANPVNLALITPGPGGGGLQYRKH